MRLTRRQAIGALTGGVVAGLASKWRLPPAYGENTQQYDIASGPFQLTWESLEQHYRLPDWYRDAKFGIWMHWGPQCQPGDGDWYAKYMYDQGRPHPSPKTL
jgi:alpha-L-fucosidase